MIKGHCYTNLDNYDTTLVNEFATVPNIGDLVRVRYTGYKSKLKVVSVTHDYRNEEPYIEVELNK